MTIACGTNSFSLAVNECAVTGKTVTIGASKGVDLTSQSQFCVAADNGTHYVSEVTYNSCNTRKDVSAFT